MDRSPATRHAGSHPFPRSLQVLSCAHAGAHREKGRRMRNVAPSFQRLLSLKRGQKPFGVAKNSKTETFRRCRI